MANPVARITIAGNKSFRGIHSDAAALRALTTYSDDDWAQVYGLKRYYEFDAASMAVDNGGTVLKPDNILVANPGRWICPEVMFGGYPTVVIPLSAALTTLGDGTSITAYDWVLVDEPAGGVTPAVTLTSAGVNASLRIPITTAWKHGGIYVFVRATNNLGQTSTGNPFHPELPEISRFTLVNATEFYGFQVPAAGTRNWHRQYREVYGLLDAALQAIQAQVAGPMDGLSDVVYTPAPGNFYTLYYDGSTWRPRKNNQTVGAPTNTDDSSLGYAVESRWITPTAEFVCADATVGAAVWHETTASASGVVIAGNLAALMLLTPADGTMGYTTSDGQHWRRTGSKWLHVNSSTKQGMEMSYGRFIPDDGELKSIPALANGPGKFIFDGALSVSSDKNANSGKGYTGLEQVLTEESVSTSAYGTITLAGKTVDVGRLTFVANPPFTANFANIFGGGEGTSLWAAMAFMATPVPSHTHEHDFPTTVYLSNGADQGWYLLYDYATNATPNDSLLVIPMSQALTAFMGGTPVLAPMATAAGVDATMVVNYLQSKGDIPTYTVYPKEYRTAAQGGAAQAVVNRGQVLAARIAFNYGEYTSALDHIVNANAAVNLPVQLIQQYANYSAQTLQALGSGSHVYWVPRTTDFSSPAAGMAAYVAGAVNRIRVYANGTMQSVAWLSDIPTATNWFEPVGSGQTYTTVSAAVAAGKKRVVLVSAVTETANINLTPTSGHLEVKFGFTGIWALGQYQITNGVYVSIEGPGTDVTDDLYRITYNPSATNQQRLSGGSVRSLVLRNVKISNLQPDTTGYSNTYFGYGSESCVLDNVRFSGLDTTGTTTLWSSPSNSDTAFNNVYFYCAGIDDVVITASADTYVPWSGGLLQGFTPGQRFANISNTKMRGVTVSAGNATATADFADCQLSDIRSYAASVGKFYFDGCQLSNVRIDNSGAYFDTTLSSANELVCDLTDVTIGGCRFSNCSLGDMTVTNVTHVLVAVSRMQTYTAATSGDHIMTGSKVGSTVGGSTGVINVGAGCTLLASACLLDDPANAGAGTFTANDCITY